MAKELDCPACDSTVHLDGDEKPGDEVFCVYCGAPFIVKVKSDEGEFEVEEDY